MVIDILESDVHTVLTEGLPLAPTFDHQPIHPEHSLNDVVAKAARASSSFPGALSIASTGPHHFRKQ